MSLSNSDCELIPVAMWSKVYIYSCMIAGIMGSNPTEGMNVHLLCLLCAVQVADSVMG
jgi:hypothetical protein